MAWRSSIVCGVSPVVHHKTTGGSLVEPKAKSGGSAGRRQHRTGLTGGPDRSDRWWSWTSRRSEAEDMRRDCIACVEGKRGAVLGCPSDGEIIKFPVLPLMGVYRLRGIVVICHLSGTRYILEKGGDGSHLSRFRVFICPSSFLFYFLFFPFRNSLSAS